MNKKVMALAVAGALAAPGAALAQITMGGGIHLQYYNHDSGSAASKKTDILETTEPEIYFAGEEKLGGGLAAWFRCTSSFDVLGTAAQSVSGAAQWCGRNSAIGMKGDFGNVFAGTWDIPSKNVWSQVRGFFGNSNRLLGSGAILQNGGPSNVGNSAAGVHRRQSRLPVGVHRRQSRLPFGVRRR